MSASCDEYCDVYRHSIVKARKQHWCSACHADIRPGDYYASVFTLFDGSVETFRRCGSCETTWQHLKAKCDEYNRCKRSNSNLYHRGNGDDHLYPMENLGCGLKYDEEWGELPDEIAALPFLGPERGQLLAPKKDDP